MTRIAIVFKRELASYFNTPIAYIFLAILLGLQGFFFFIASPFFALERAEMRSFFALMPISLFIFAPAVTMRLWSEELRVGTAEILLTLPYKVYELVVGKFLAAYFVLGLALVLSFGIPLGIAWFGDPDWGPIIGGYLGSFLMGGMFLALGAFISSLTQNQVVALLVAVSIGALLVIGLGPQTVAIVSTSYPSLGSFMEAAGVASHFDSVERGVLALSDVVYFVGGMVFFLALNILFVQSKRY
ncbi:MAG: ABC transporter permease [Planctomycetes bacterium]|nr:ABC transporter permease [Planctomycetota bacterium]